MTTGDDEGCRQAVRYGDQQVERGHGSETHQIAAEGGPRLTTQQGTVVSDDQNTLRAGERGPGALEDFHFREPDRDRATETEQQHITDAFVFELSKCGKTAIRSRMVAALRNVDEDLARSVADGLGLPELPDALPPAREPVRDLPASPALSILANGPGSFAGRKLGILVTDGADAAKLAELTAAAEDAKVTVELVAPAVGGIEASDGHRVAADQKIDGGPSVLYDAVIVLTAKDGAEALAALPAARDFVTDAYAHCKFIGYTGDATPLFEAAGLSRLMDDGFISLGETAAAEFISQCAELRFWSRQLSAARAQAR